MQIQPRSARFHAETSADGFRVVIPARRNWFVMLFLVAWLGGWAFGEVNAAGELIHAGDKTPSAFLAFWIVGWTLGGLITFGTVLWQLAGREVLTVNSLSLTHRLEIFGIGVNRSYGASDIRNLRATEYSHSPFTNQNAWFPPLFGSGYGPLAFDYGARTIRVGSSLEEAEAKLLAGSLVPYLPRQL